MHTTPQSKSGVFNAGALKQEFSSRILLLASKMPAKFLL